MIEYSKVSFGSFVKSAMVQLALFLALAALLYMLIYQLTGSHVYSIFSVLAFVVSRQIFFGGRLKKRARQVESVFSNIFPVGEKIKLSNPNSGWLKGVGFINDVNQPMWVRFSGQYFEFFFLARSRRPPFLIHMEEIEEIFFLLPDKSLAKLKIKNIDADVVIPWSENVNDQWGVRLRKIGEKGA